MVKQNKLISFFFQRELSAKLAPEPNRFKHEWYLTLNYHMSLNPTRCSFKVPVKCFYHMHCAIHHLYNSGCNFGNIFGDFQRHFRVQNLFKNGWWLILCIKFASNKTLCCLWHSRERGRRMHLFIGADRSVSGEQASLYKSTAYKFMHWFVLEETCKQ